MMTPVAEFCEIEEVMLFDAWLRITGIISSTIGRIQPLGESNSEICPEKKQVTRTQKKHTIFETSKYIWVVISMFFIFTPNPREMIQFDDCAYFLNRLGKNHQPD